MIYATVLVISSVISAVYPVSRNVNVEFPPWFKFGAATAAYQIEGAWNVSDKAESIWDRFIHEDPNVIADVTNADVACDSYHQWRRDVEMAAEIGLQFYRFSIAWTRVLPTGYSNVISEDGKTYYNNLIDGLLEKGIEPVVTLYHFDLPQYFQDLGGWTNPLIVDWFSSYARVAFTLFGDRVKTWITINEPNILCDLTYTTGILAPGYIDSEMAPFLCTKHVLLAHAKAWRIYDKQFKPLHRGRYCHPIYSKQGGWPATTEKLMREVSSREGYDASRLPELTKDDIELIKGTYDFFALNYYTCRLVRRAKPGERVDTFFMQGIPELKAVMEVDPEYPYGLSRFVVHCPKGLREQMSWLKQQYGDLQILVSENGMSTAGSNMEDAQRQDFIREHLEQILLSIKLDGVNVTGYTYWSLMDNFEWVDRYQIKFGLYEVDFKSEKRKRSPRASASFKRKCFFK